MHHRSAPLGHFLPWAKLFLPPISRARTDSRIRRFFARTTSCYEHAFLHDVRTGVLVQTIDLDNQLGEPEGGGISYVDVNERHAFVCTPRALYLYARGQDATKVLEVPYSSSFNNFHSRASQDSRITSLGLCERASHAV